MAVETNWKVFLSEDSELPPDVSFYIRGDDEDGGKKFRAHKLLLAGVSPVFRQQFFGPMKDTEEVVEVEETTPEAFETMLNYIYKPPGKDTFSLNKIDCQKLFELLALARKYMIPNLETVALTALDTLAIRRENMIFTATVATKYKRIFDDLSKKLMVKCLEWLFQTTKGAGDIFALIMETKENFPEASLDILHELLSVGNETLQVPGNYNQWNAASSNCVMFNTI